MQGLQYDMFVDKAVMTAEEAHILRQEMKHVMDSADRVRRGLFARLSEQGKVILKLMQEIEDLKGKKKNIIFEFNEPELNLFRKSNG